MKKYRELFLAYYEFAMWAHSVDLDAVVSEKQLGTPSLMTENRRRIFLLDMDEYQLREQDSNQVTYRFPDMRPRQTGDGYGGVSVQKTVGIATERLNYWINRFPFSFEDLEGPTILEKYENQYSNVKQDRKTKEAALKVRAYERVLSTFVDVDREIKSSYRALKDARALLK